MDYKRQFSLYLLRFMPFARRDDFVTIGFVLWEDNDFFKQVRFVQDEEMLRRMAPEIELDWFKAVYGKVSDRLKIEENHKAFEQFIDDNFGDHIQVAPSKAVLSGDPFEEMKVLESIHIAPVRRAEAPILHIDTPEQRGPRFMVGEMRRAFEKASVSGLLQERVDMTSYTGKGDPFRIHFGYRIDQDVHMFHAISLASNADEALALAYRYSKIESGMRAQEWKSSLMAIVETRPSIDEERHKFAISTLEGSGIVVSNLGQIDRIAAGIKADFAMKPST